ncbi:MAG: hypothetical protein RI957_2277, partial [Verrucomicrobiota bacterium]
MLVRLYALPESAQVYQEVAAHG